MFSVAVLFAVIELGGTEFNGFLFLIALFFGLIFVLLPVLSRWWYFSRRRLMAHDITAEFAPPMGLTPAEVSYLFKGKLGDKEVVATIVHLAQRGLLHVKKHEGHKRVFAGPRVDSRLTTYEKMLISQADNEKGIAANALVDEFITFGLKGSEQSGVPKSYAMTQLVKERLVQKGYVKNKSIKNFLTSMLNITLLFISVLVVLPLTFSLIISLVSSGASEMSEIVNAIKLILMSCILSALPVFVLSALIVKFRGGKSGRKWIITQKLKRFWSQVVGFRQYVQLAEKDKLKFRTTDLKKKSHNDMLPYSVALGFIKDWREIVN